MTATLAHSLNRTVVIRATRETVFRYFTDSARWAAGWGAGSSIDARPGGSMRIRYPDGTEAVGEVLDIAAPERIVFSYGYGSGAPIPAGGSRVTIHLDAHEAGTRVRLVHEMADAAVRDQHIQGWRYQLSLFGNLVANDVNAGAAVLVDGWFDAWAMTDEGERERAVESITASTIQFGDKFSVIDGRSELVQHIGGALRFMPGVRLRRNGDIRHCQGTVLADWIATRDGQPLGTGTNVFVLEPGGRIGSVTGFWN